MSHTSRLGTYAKLGFSNLAKVALYRFGLKSGLHPVQWVRGEAASGPFLRESERRGDLPDANTAWDEVLWWFGWYHIPLPDSAPDWFANPFSDTPQPDASRDWWRIADFNAGDIKGLWEMSRFNWVVAWATKAAHGDTMALARLNDWLANWARENPPYMGPNWKCGQEASIRVMHLVVAAWVLGQDCDPEPGLVDLLRTHLRRIAPTMSYAIGQQNNHGTSEAAALFIGGSFLAGHDPRADAWVRKGRYWLEERARRLIAPDGTFSQYSVTYQRMVLDTYSLAEAWRRHRNLPAFSQHLYDRLASATNWLAVMVDGTTGDAPNMGANDGAHLLQLTDSDYRDFRPSVQLAAALFMGRDAFGDGTWNIPLRWLEVPNAAVRLHLESRTFQDGGYHVLRTGNTFAVLRFPRFHFRPGQADALHVDLWHDGINLLRDAGTFSYNAEETAWFAGTAAHNTIEFDGRDQMPRLGRFLFGNWLDAETVEPVHQCGKTVSAAAGYTDMQGARHHRQITLSPGSLLCLDTVSGQFEQACLRWRLVPGSWKLEGNALANESIRLSIEVDGNPVKPDITTTAESRYYLHQVEVPLASVSVTRPAKLLTKITF